MVPTYYYSDFIIFIGGGIRSYAMITYHQSISPLYEIDFIKFIFRIEEHAH